MIDFRLIPLGMVWAPYPSPRYGLRVLFNKEEFNITHENFYAVNEETIDQT